MNRQCALVVATVAFSVHAVPAKVHAQPGIFRAAAQYVQRTVLRQHVSVDPKIYAERRLGPPPVVGTAAIQISARPLPVEPEDHPDSVLAEVRGDSLIAVMSRERALVCRGPWKPECKTNGPESFVRFSSPVVRGDSAYMDAVYWVIYAPTAADTAAAVRANPLYPLDRLTPRGGGHVAKIILLRSNGAWRVVEYKVTMQT